MFEALLDCVSLLRVENKHLTKKVQSNRIGLRIKRCPTLFVSLWQFPDIFTSEIVTYKCHILVSWCSQYSDCSFNLIKIVVTWEKWRSSKKFGKDASDTPDIECVSIMTSIQYNFWGSIPSCDDILCQCCGCLFVSSGQSEITNLEVTIFIEK